MTTWILTIGNSDVQLRSDTDWKSLYDKNKKQEDITIPRKFRSLEGPDANTQRYMPSARVMGWVYGDGTEHYDDVVFPLLDVFKTYFQPEEKPAIAIDHVYLLFSDQSAIFQAYDREGTQCPFWTDTCTLEPIIRAYLTKEFNLTEQQITALILKPEAQIEGQLSRGIDHWNEMLGRVEELLLPEYFEDEKIYVSYQAGTPAISSAVQFVSISRSNDIKFLVSNQLYNPNKNKETYKYEAELITSSQYWRRMQIQKAKKLLVKGNPAAALEIVRELTGLDTAGIQEMVNKFNLKSKKSQTDDEFEPLAAARRVRDSLDLIEIFLENENYLQAIALLAAAHETFLKAAIIRIISCYIAPKTTTAIIDNWIIWDKQGLYLRTINSKKINSELQERLKIPSATFKKYIDWEKPNFSIGNSYLFLWLKDLLEKYRNLAYKDWIWGNLEWTMRYKREYDHDLRNQLMHNLRGMEKRHTIAYLKGKPQDRNVVNKKKNVEIIFKEEIKTKFISAMSKIFLDKDGTTFIQNEMENHIQQELNELAEQLK